jgi:hypothetical protein
MTKKFNSTLRYYLNLFEANDHLVTPPDSRSEVDVEYYTDKLVEALRIANVFKTSEDYIDFNKFVKTEDTNDGKTTEFTWIGFGGEYTVRSRESDDHFISIILCNDNRLDGPKSSENMAWESYVDLVAEYIVSQEKVAEDEKRNENEQFKGEEAIELKSSQPSALPGAPSPGEAPQGGAGTIPAPQ